MKNSLLILILIYCTGNQSIAQQASELYFPASHRFYLDNPAAVGINGESKLMFGAHKKWSGISNSPFTGFISSSHALRNKNIAFGGFLLQDQAGLIQQTRASLYSAFHINPEANQQISIGTSIQYQRFGFNQPVNPKESGDPLFTSDVLNSGILNLGIAINYHQKFGEGKSYANFMLHLPQFGRDLTSIDLDLEPIGREDSTLISRLSQNFIIQGNFRIEFDNGMAFTPSLRYQMQPEINNDVQVARGYSIIDLGLGLSFKEDKFRIRLGGRTAEANQIYAGIGMVLSDKVDVFLYSEPTNILGIGYGGDAVIELGGRKQGSYVWQKQDYYKQILEVNDLSLAFTAQPFNVPDSDKTFVSFSFFDNDDKLYNFVGDKEFVSQIDIPKLLTEIEKLITEIKNDGGRILKVKLISECYADLDDIVDKKYAGGETTPVTYYREEFIKTQNFSPGVEIDKGQLAAIKLHNLLRYIQGMHPEVIGLNPPSLEVKRNSFLDEERKILIQLEIKRR